LKRRRERIKRREKMGNSVKRRGGGASKSPPSPVCWDFCNLG